MSYVYIWKRKTLLSLHDNIQKEKQCERSNHSLYTVLHNFFMWLFPLICNMLLRSSYRINKSMVQLLLENIKYFVNLSLNRIIYYTEIDTILKMPNSLWNSVHMYVQKYINCWGWWLLFFFLSSSRAVSLLKDYSCVYLLLVYCSEIVLHECVFTDIISLVLIIHIHLGRRKMLKLKCI